MNTTDKYSATTSSHVLASVAKWNSAWLAYNQYQTEFESEEGAIFGSPQLNTVTYNSLEDFVDNKSFKTRIYSL